MEFIKLTHREMNLIRSVSCILALPVQNNKKNQNTMDPFRYYFIKPYRVREFETIQNDFYVKLGLLLLGSCILQITYSLGVCNKQLLFDNTGI